MKPRVFNKHKGAPAGAVYIGRGSKWGNPFVIGKDGDRNGVCDAFIQYALSNPEFIRAVKEELRGKDLVCFCKPLRCHGDFLLLIANEAESENGHDDEHGETPATSPYLGAYRPLPRRIAPRASRPPHPRTEGCRA